MAATVTSRAPVARVFAAAGFALQGPAIWGLHLAIVYAVHHLACRAGARPETVAALIMAATLGAVAAIVMAAMLSGRWVGRGDVAGDALWRFLDSLRRWLAVVSVAGIVWAGSALAFVAVCAR